MATIPDIVLYAGEDMVIRITIYDQTGVIKNLNGATGLNFRIGDNRDGTYLFAKEGTLATDGTDGIVDIDILSSESISFTARTWNYQLVVTDAESDVQVVKAGIIEIRSLLPTS